MQPKVLRILVVENHPDTRQGIQLFLQALGHHTLPAGSMTAALALAAHEPFDVLLSDVSLPDGDGWTLLGALIACGQRPPHAFAMSGLGSAEDFARSREAGFERHLLKPFPPEELEEALLGISRDLVSGVPRLPDPPPTLPKPGRLQQRMHDGLCQQLAAASLLQAALVHRLEQTGRAAPGVDLRPGEEPKTLPPAVLVEARQVSQLIHEALQETQTLMRELPD